jgi:3-dehydro-L-gulonate 2-dehydrogenase
MKVHFENLKEISHTILCKVSFPDSEASQIALIFTESTFDGVFSHGINRFPRFINDVKKGVVNPGLYRGSK